jgi:hypothetical protein
MSAVIFYICPICFEVYETGGECHGHVRVCCDVGEPGDERRKPEINGGGRLKSRAPRWFLEAISRPPAQPPTSR